MVRAAGTGTGARAGRVGRFGMSSPGYGEALTGERRDMRVMMGLPDVGKS